MGACCGKPSNAVGASDNPSLNQKKGQAVGPQGAPVSFIEASGQSSTQEGQAGTEEVTTLQSKSAVKVAVVVRPLLPAEKAKKGVLVVELVGPGVLKIPQRVYTGGGGPPHTDADKMVFSFDRVYRMDSREVGKQLFAMMVEPLLGRYLSGCNATVFAYGQTGSGKTFVMGTAATAKQVRGASEETVIPSSIHFIFKSLAALKQEYSIAMKMTYVQIHEDSILDLLADATTPRSNSINLREHPTKGIYLENAKESDISNVAELATALEEGNARRVVASHNMNEFSSRSHAVLSLYLEQRRKPNAPVDPSKHKYLASKFNLVDLAGSERAKETGATGQQFAEGVTINKGLLALGNVISALTEGANRKHVPYRDSKLTRILQDSLGGTSETLMVACCSPASFNQEQTINTLRYASRARQIQNRVKLNNKYSVEDELAFLKKTVAEKEALIQQLQQENYSLRSASKAA